MTTTFTEPRARRVVFYKKSTEFYRIQCFLWCEWRGSNPHAQRAQDFKSRLSASSNTLAQGILYPMSGGFVKVFSGKKKNRRKTGGLCRNRDKLGLFGSAHRAIISASAAIDALFSVDFVLAIAFGDRLHGAIRFTSAAADARISNLVCHDRTPPYVFPLSRLLNDTISGAKMQGSNRKKPIKSHFPG